MELGHYQLQFFVSSLVILGAALAALICYFLKRNNDQLRELTIELKIRHEEEQRRSHLLTHLPAEQAPKTEKIAAPGQALAVPNVTPKERSAVGEERKRTVNS